MDEVTIPANEYEDLLEKATKAETYGRSASEAQALDHELKFRDDETYFATLVHADKKVAQRIVDKYGSKYGVTTIEEMVAYTKKKEFESMKQQEESTKGDEKYADLLAKTGLEAESDLGKKIKEEFDDLMEGKKKTPDNVAKYFNKAFASVKGVSDYSKAKNSMGSTPGFGTGEQKAVRLSDGLKNSGPSGWYKTE